MNHVNWVQQDPDYQTQYHVLKWDSSHFHEPQARQMVDSALPKESAALAVSANSEKTGTAEIGFGLVSSVKSGGFALGHGQEGVMLQESQNGAQRQDGVFISGQGAQRQQDEITPQQAETRQAEMAEGILISKAAEHLGHPGYYDRAKPAAGTEEGADGQIKSIAAAGGQGNVRSRLKEGAAQLRETYQKEKEKIRQRLFRAKRIDKQKDMPKKSKKEVDREETLSMQAQNHYLLDSYDRNGKYSMLGK